MTSPAAAFAAFLRQVHRRRKAHGALAAAAWALAGWTVALAVAVGVGRLVLGVPVGAVAAGLALAGAMHGAWRAVRARATTFDTAVWIDRTLGLPETAATAAELLGRPDAGEFRDVLARRALAEAEPRWPTLRAFGSPPIAFEVVVGAAVVALAVAFLPGAAPESRVRTGGERREAEAAGAGTWLSEEEARRAQLDEIREARAQGAPEAAIAARLARLEHSAEPMAPTSAGERETDLDARLASLARRLELEEGPGTVGGGTGSGAVPAQPDAGGGPAPRSAMNKQEALMGRPDWPRDLDPLVARYFER